MGSRSRAARVPTSRDPIQDGPRDNQRAAYDNGTAGAVAKRVSPQLEGKTGAQMEDILDAELAADPTGRRDSKPIDDPTGGKQNQLLYVFTDGTLVRLKPKGDTHNVGKPMYSVEVQVATPVPGAGQSNVAFKVDAQSRAVPKSGDDAANPYTQQTSPTQFNAYESIVIKAGHRVSQ